VSDGVFALTKIGGVLVRPDTWLVLSVACIGAALLIQRTRLAGWLCATTLGGLLVLSIFPFGDLLVRHIEGLHGRAALPAKVDGIIVLGGGEDVYASAQWSRPQLGEGAERLTEAVRLSRLYPQAVVLFSGGGTMKTGAISEASIARQFFLEQGVDVHRLVLETRSRNTVENAKLSAQLVKTKPDQAWVLVTSAFHMPRAMQLFRQAGWEIVPYPVDYRSRSFVDGVGWDLMRNLKMLGIAVKEYVGVFMFDAQIGQDD